MHLHILGICGTFMGGIAAIAKAAGHTVTGCDANVYPPMSTQLAALGIDLVEGFDPAQLDGPAGAADVFVVGNVVSRGNPLIEAVLDRGLPYVSGPQWLAENVLAGKWVLAVAGTHGKTTTTAMLAWILDHANLQPGFLIGGVPLDFGVSARLTDSPFFVLEADEYDTAFFDKRSKFVHYRPRTAILNNLEYDHADIFPDLAAIETQFHHLVRTVPKSGRLVVNGGEASLARVLARGCWSEVERFGLAEVPGTGPDWTIGVDGTHPARRRAAGHAGVRAGGAPQPAERAGGDRRRASCRRAGAREPRRTGRVQGRQAPPRTARQRERRHGLGRFRASSDGHRDHRRRPAAAARPRCRGAGAGNAADGDAGARILAVLEPRSNTMKLGAMKDALPGSLAGADRVFCYAANLGWDAGGALAPLGERASVHADLAALVAAVAAVARPGDQVLVMSNGGFGGVHDKLLAALGPPRA